MIARALALLLWAGAALAGPGTLLVPETGFHTAPIRQCAADARGERLITAGEDRTLRVWDLPSLELRRVIRPPQGPGDEGKLYACALSPDGHLAAASGFTRGAAGGHQIYLFDPATGAMAGRIRDLPQVVNSLAFSPDGRRLAANLGGTSGLRIYAMPEGVEVFRDTQYGAASYGGAFSPDGHYLATAHDGFLRLYSREYELQSKVRAPARDPLGAAFNPQGTQVAVAYYDQARVDVLSARTLFPVFRPAAGSGPLTAVAWSADGATLYAAGGRDFPGGFNPVVAWAGGGRGERREVPGARATISSLVPLPGGGLVVAAQDPRLVLLGPDLAPRRSLDSGLGDPARAREAFRADPAGTAVRLPWLAGATGPRVFQLRGHVLGEEAPGLAPAVLEAPGLKVGDWRDGEHPTCNGAPLAGLERGEVVRSLSLAPGGGFVLGTDWCLRGYDPSGQPTGSVPVPAACWGLLHTADRRFLLAALADGTVRWYRAAGLAEVAALYVHPDQARWLLWAPDGTYDCGPGGESLFGALVQRDGEAGDFFPIGRFRDRLNRPEALVALLGGQAPAPPAPLPRRFPPVLRILAPGEGADPGPGVVTLRLGVRRGSPEGSLSFQVFRDGGRLTPAGPARPAPGEAEFALDLDLPPGPCRISVVAVGGEGASEPAEIRLAGRARPQPAAPRLNLMAVGISHYTAESLRLTFPAKDARDLAQVFQGQASRLYGQVSTWLLLDGEATREGVLATLRKVRAATAPDTVTLIFLSGHGFTIPEESSYYFVPAETDFQEYAKAFRVMVPSTELMAEMGRMQGKVILMMDTCHAGFVLGEGALRSVDDMAKLTRMINELAQAENGVTVFSSSTGQQYSLEARQWNNGAFTKALVEGLGGLADPEGLGKVSLRQLDTYLRRRVAELTKGRQTPISSVPGSKADFPLVVLAPMAPAPKDLP